MSATDNSEKLEEKNGTEAANENLQNPFLKCPGDTKKPNFFSRQVSGLISHIKNPRNLKAWIKASIAAWVVTIFMFINPILDNFGQATFFGGLVIFFIPPSGAVLLTLFAQATLLVGMCVGWAWGVITMEAATHARTPTETQELLQSLAAAASRPVPNSFDVSGQTAYSQVLIFNGFALDTRVSAVYLCLGGLLVYLLGRLRVAKPKLTFLSIFGMIVTDIFITIGPLLPTPQLTIPQILIKPAAAAVGVGLACNLLIFPESTSSIALDALQHVIEPMKPLLDAWGLRNRHPELEFKNEAFLGARQKVLGSYKQFQGSLGLLPLDFSIGKWGAQDVISLQVPVRKLMLSFLALLQLQLDQAATLETGNELYETKRKGDANPGIKTFKFGRHQQLRSLDLLETFSGQETREMHEQSLKSLRATVPPIRQACASSLAKVVEAISLANNRRWFRRLNSEQLEKLNTELQREKAALQKHREEFVDSITGGLLEPYQDFFDANGHLKSDTGILPSQLRGLLLGLVFEDRFYDFAQKLEGLLDHVIDLQTERSKTKLWAPLRLLGLWSWMMRKESSHPSDPPPPPHDNESVDSDETYTDSSPNRLDSKDEKGKPSQDVESKVATAEQWQSLRFTPGKKRGRSGRWLLNTIDWFTNVEGQFGIRAVIVTVALAIPAVCTESAGFFYQNRGLWALIMAQTGLVSYSSEFVYNFLIRIFGTILGGVVGMVAWYIGAGYGPGNSYGMAAIMAVVIIAAMYFRLFGNPAFFAAYLLTAATIYLVVGYSWADTHIPSYGNPGVGYNVFWRRTVLVLIGFAASAIVIFFPKPPSATRSVCGSLAKSIKNTKDLYSLFLSTWQNRPADLIEVVQGTIIGNSEMLGALKPRIGLLKFEFSSMPFDARNLSECHKHCLALNTNMIQIYMHAQRLELPWKRRFAKLTGAFDPKAIADFMAVLTMAEAALKTGDPLPAILPTPLLERFIAYGHTNVDMKADQVLNIKHMREDGFRNYIVLVHSLIRLLGAADMLMLKLKEAVGEVHDVRGWESQALLDAREDDDEEVV